MFPSPPVASVPSISSAVPSEQMVSPVLLISPATKALRTVKVQDLLFVTEHTSSLVLTVAVTSTEYIYMLSSSSVGGVV